MTILPLTLQVFEKIAENKFFKIIKMCECEPVTAFFSVPQPSWAVSGMSICIWYGLSPGFVRFFTLRPLGQSPKIK